MEGGREGGRDEKEWRVGGKDEENQELEGKRREKGGGRRNL